MKYSMKKRCNGRIFRYNYSTDNLEYVVWYHRRWSALEWISVDRSDWKDRYARKAIMEDFCEMIADAEFGAKYNVVLEEAMA